MSEEMPTAVVRETQKLDMGPSVELFQLDCSIFGGDTFAFHNQRLNGDGIIVFGGIGYQPLSIHAEGFALNGTEQSPTPTIEITSLGGVLPALINQYDNLTGATVRRIRTYRKFLDDGSTPDSTARISYDIYYVNRKLSENKLSVKFELGSSMDVEGAVVPKRRLLIRCQANFKDGVDCPYTGSDSTCGKLVSDCQAKFGTGVDLPFMGFPSVERTNLML